MTVVLAKRSISPDTTLRCERPPPPGHNCLPVIHISASEGGGQPEGRALSSLAFQRQVDDGPPSLPSPKGGRPSTNRPPLRGLGTSETSEPAVKTAGCSK